MSEEAPLFERALIAYARKFPLRKGKLRVVDRLWRAAAGRHGSVRMANLRHGGFRMTCDLTELLQRQFYYFGTYFVEEKLLDRWAKEAEQAKVVFDVGANLGIYSLAALASRPGAIVHAFEPTPEIAQHLRETVVLNALDNLIVHQVAVSNRCGKAALHRLRGELGTNEGMNYIGTDKSAHEGAPGESVQTVSLDEFCRQHGVGQIDLLKLDVQGHEFPVLQGAESLIRLGKIHTVFMELNWAGQGEADCPATQSVRLLEQAGFLFAAPDEDARWRKAGTWLRSLSDVMARRVGDC